MTDPYILSEIKQLPETLQQEVLRFVSFLKQEHQSEVKQENTSKERTFGRSKGKYILSEDFDEPLEDFKDYM